MADRDKNPVTNPAIPQTLLNFVQSVLAGPAATRPPLPATIAAHRLIHLTLRAKGRRLHAAWVDGTDLADCLHCGLTAAMAAIKTAENPSPTTVEITLPHPATPLNPDMLRRAQANDFRGLFGIEARSATQTHRIGPLEMISRNLGPNTALQSLRDQAGTDATAHQFAADQFLVDLAAARGHRLFRGQRIVAQTDITRATTQDMADKMTDWLCRQIGPDGAATYKYAPSSGSYSTANNMIRQFMATACLALADTRYATPQLRAATDRNFAFNFAQFYAEQDDFAVIDEFGKLKLGAAAVAVMAILNRADPAPYLPHLARLQRFLEGMQNPDGSFRTFLAPEGRNDNQNFYPGEALLALAMLHQRNPDPALQSRIMAGFYHYRDWHRANRNPAFVPWHTQAYCLLYATTKNPDLADFVFEINDWLLPIQETPPRPADVVGDFFDPARPEFGPPHASSTGVYLEGLIEAWQLAVATGDQTRADAYRHALLRGLRSLRQLQYRSHAEMFYIHKKQRVLGAVRTSNYDNTVRIDNVQHGLMAIYKTLDLFTDADFQLS